jgi:hypothetical protein
MEQDMQTYTEFCDTTKSYYIYLKNKETNSNTKEDNMTDTSKTLYEYKATKSSKVTTFGHHIATNSGGLWVMEEKGTGNIQAVSKSTVSKVVPNCVGVRFLTGSNASVYHYFAPKGLYKTGEVYTMLSPSGMSLVIIASEDCESDLAKKDFKPLMKILTEKVDSP